MMRLFKIIGSVLLGFVLLIVVVLGYIKWGMAPEHPEAKNEATLDLQREKVGENHFRIGNNWLRKNQYGIWEEYVEGDPFTRGVILGKLNKEMLYTQEKAFVDQIHQLIPNDNYLSFLALFTRVFNRNLEENFPEENKLEIYGESFSAPHEFDYISPAYDRMLNYHAAHDIGHALQNFALVGCTSFSAWDGKSSDSSLIIGRNFDFSLGDKFGEDKIVLFCKPEDGHRFAMVTWAGFMGCVSGMNEKGLTVTLNAAKSDFPNASATPIAILAREILQYAGTIDEAFAIAKKRKTFVCETLMIGSAADHRTALIEKSITKTVLVQSDTNFILCANHYQSDSFRTDKNNLENIATSASMYRFIRLQELMQQHEQLDYTHVAEILRDQKGQQEKNIGMGNEKALNQLLSHHAVIFQPEQLRMWVTANPYQLGAFVCYDLRKIFEEAPAKRNNDEIYEQTLNIAPDSFLYSGNWKNYNRFKAIKKEIRQAVLQEKPLPQEQNLTANFIATNPEFWETYYWLAEYEQMRGRKSNAVALLKTALTKEVNDRHEVEKMEKQLQQWSRP
ncbi:MAG: hypothetical protein IPH78_05260 [Bacteroidetes bacterium]|nr:hypothetical protein [Bacteroidota bacterium]